MNETFYIVTGAPGAGKTVVVQELLKRSPAFLIYDTDWLLNAASELTGKDVLFDSSTWAAYRKLWFEVLHMAQQNHKQAVLFAAIDKDDVAVLGQEFASRVGWCLLDCSDETRKERLAGRSNWTDSMLEEATKDAQKLRNQIDNTIQTDTKSVSEISDSIVAWLAAN